MVIRSISEDVKENPVGIKVMGIDNIGYPFYGTTIGNVRYNDSGHITSVDVEGTLICGDEVISFGRGIMPINRLKHLDRDAFGKLYALESERSHAIKTAAVNIEKAKNAFAEMKQLLDI